MPWWIAASVVANVAIIITEYLNRSTAGLGNALMHTWPFILTAQVCLYFAWRTAPSLLLVWAVFTLGNSIMRIAMVGLWLHEPLKWTWIVLGISLMFVGSYAIKMGTTG